MLTVGNGGLALHAAGVGGRQGEAIITKRACATPHITAQAFGDAERTTTAGEV